MSGEAQLRGLARDTELLLAERATPPQPRRLRVACPATAVSSLVTMARDPAELARQVRRPMPRRPAPYARRGTAFHQWLEQRFGQPQLIDADDLPGAADGELAAAPGDREPELAELKEAVRGQRVGGPLAAPRSRCRSRR